MKLSIKIWGFFILLHGSGLSASNATIVPINNTCQDTTIRYDLNGISAEGAEAIVSYCNRKIKRGVINVYGETGQAKIYYDFQPDRINVTQQTYFYKKQIEDVKTDEDMTPQEEIVYSMDYSGNLLEPTEQERIDIFLKFKEIVPWKL